MFFIALTIRTVSRVLPLVEVSIRAECLYLTETPVYPKLQSVYSLLYAISSHNLRHIAIRVS